jgi:hypothetical protein
LTDFSWAYIHALVHVLNKQNISQYAKRVFDFANDRLSSDQIKSQSWLVSCAAHTTHRLTHTTKNLIKKKEASGTVC